MTLRIALFTAVLVVSAGVHPPTIARADARTEARRLYRQGMALIRSGEQHRGVAYLLQAYETMPHPNVLYNAARAYAEIGAFEESIELFERYLGTDPPDRDQVDGFIASMQEILRARAAAEAEVQEAAEAAADAEETAPTPRTTEVLHRPEDVRALEEAASRLETVTRAIGADPTATDQLTAALRRIAARLRNPPPPSAVASTQSGTEAVAEAAEAAEAVADAQAETEDLVLVEARDEELYEERVVSASRFSESSVTAPNATSAVTAQDIRLSGLTNPAELLRRAPGVEVMTLSPGDTQVSIRGLNQRLSNKVLVLIDGRSVYLDFLGTTIWHNLPVSIEDVERIEVIRGPASAVYGADAYSGVVNLILREPGRGQSFFNVGAGTGDTVRAVGSVNDRIESVSYRLSVGMDRSDNYAIDIDPSRVDYDTVDREPFEGREHFWGRADGRVRLDDELELSLGAGISKADLNVYAISRLQQTKAEEFWFSQAYADLTMPEGLRAQVFWNRHEADITRLERPTGAPLFTSFGITHVLDTELSWSRQGHLGVDHNLIVGAGYRLKTVTWNWLDDDHRQHHFAVFAHDTMDVVDGLQGVLSLRVDRHPLLDSLQVSPRGAVIVLPTDGSAVRATAGAAFRSPTFLESYLQTPFTAVPVRGVTTLSRGDENLDAERIVSFELGYENQDSDYFAAEASAYFNILDDAIVFSRITDYTLSDYARGRVDYVDEVQAFPVAEIAFDNEDVTFIQMGGEAGVRVFPISGLDVFANYSLHDTRPLSDVQLGGRENERRTSRHKINAGAQYRSSIGLDLSVDIHWYSRQIWYLQVTDLERGGIAFSPFEVPAYTLLNARVGYRLLEDHLELGVTGTNLVAPDHREHPYGQPVERRFMATVTGRL